MKPHILLVEDDEALLILLRKALHDHYDVTTVRTGAEAMAYYEKQQKAGAPYATLILDVHLWGTITGYDVARYVRKKDNATNIVFLSAEQDGDGPSIALELGAKWLQKPVTVPEIEALL